MSTPSDRPLDALGLARSAARIEREFEVAHFERLGDRLAEPSGRAQARAEFGLEGSWPVVQLAVEAEVALVCQRCLRPMRQKIESASRLVFAEEGVPELPEGFEPVGGDPRKLDLAALVEDELLLALPIIPQHGEDESCELPRGGTDEEAAVGEMRRPFAGLKDLLKH
jgi:uncharacterized protein